MTTAQRDGVAIVTIDNPPVNALSYGVLAALVMQIDAADADAAIGALVVTGANGIFSGGADLREFGAPPRHPNLRDLIDRLERTEKPVVAAIAGSCVGGGLEVALACDERVATVAAKLGFPEIERGLLPGAGGTQRAPRLMGIAAALDLILSGEPIDGAAARARGLVDELVTGDVVAAASARATTLAGRPRRRISEQTVAPDDAALERARERAQPLERGGLAARRCIDAVAGTARLPFGAGLAAERVGFEELVRSEQSKARIHVFFAERQAAKSADGAAPPTTAVRRAVVIGGGTMGTGIAMACADAGIAVTLVDLEAGVLERARGTIGGNYAATVAKGRLERAAMDARLARIAFGNSLAAAADVDLVIEAVFEDMDVKRSVFREVDRVARAGTLLASNTSTLDIDALAAATSRPRDVVGLHFFSPANVMRLLEIVRGAQTSQATLAAALAIAKQLGKVGVVAGNCDGFIGNRMLYAYRREAEFLLEEGGTPERIDAALKRFGMAMGPFAMSDLAGLDIGWRIRRRRYANTPPAGRYSRVADTLCELGRFGQKTGAGYYRYEPGKRTPRADPAVDAIVERLARESGIARRPLDDDEIVKRCIYPLVNEAGHILTEGIATRPGDIDVVWVYGYGFPAFRGGPLRFADSVGLGNVVAGMRAFERAHGQVWQPAPLLAELAASNRSFGQGLARVRARA